MVFDFGGSSSNTPTAKSIPDVKPFGEESLKSVEGRDFRVNGKMGKESYGRCEDG